MASTVITFLALAVPIWSLPPLIPTQYPGVYQLTEPVDHAECPSWDDRNNILYYVNIHDGQVYRYDYEQGTVNYITLDGEVAPVIPSKRDPNLLIVGLGRSVAAVEWDGVSDPSETRILAALAPDFPTSRVNDGKADKQGRLWIGTMGYEGPDGLTPDEGILYQVTCDNLDSPLVEIAPVNISNGLAWNAANDKFYYIDSPSFLIVEYSYNDETGEISDRRVVFDRTAHDLLGDPDGMTIDEDDNLWVALYGGGRVIKIDSSNGDLLEIVPLPALDVTSAIWGGPDLDILYVTTSRVSLTDEQKLEQPAAGAVFAIVNLGTKGRPTFEVDLLGSIDDETCGAKKVLRE
ncbi:regucalcin-like [Zophobas morio]|uniref:regucalcin-like n=1 Tax=Zophobas morio TaxID=2755281 RepID=UPI003083C7C6